MLYVFCSFFFFKQKTAYEMRISDWSSDVCSSDLHDDRARELAGGIGRDMRQHRAVAQMDVPVVGAADGQAVGHDISPLPLGGGVRVWKFAAALAQVEGQAHPKPLSPAGGALSRRSRRLLSVHGQHPPQRSCP